VSLRRGGEHQEAWELAQEADERYRRRYPGTPGALAAALEVACCRSALGDEHGARDLAAEIVENYRSDLGPDHPTTLIALNNLATYLRATGEVPEATRMAHTVVSGLGEQLGEDHPLVLAAAVNLANCLAA